MSGEGTTTPEGGSTTSTPAPPAATTFSQADVDRIVADRLRREREKYADYDDLKAKAAEADTSKSELQKLTDRVTAAEKRAADAEARQLRAEVAQAKGLTAAQAKRLTGSTKEELEADADELLEAFGGKKGDAKPDDKPDGGESDDAGAAIFGRPKERLTPGAAPDKEPEKTGEQLADEVLKKARGF
ncbi:hypothetical protein AB0K34_11035 [Actinomadura sp. NPDC049382]|uniref:hypothetical protein n=1 Tax=Actinomadura sp. NPDC049382 TaxID=3158220 RepID=UPI003441C560